MLGLWQALAREAQLAREDRQRRVRAVLEREAGPEDQRREAKVAHLELGMQRRRASNVPPMIEA